MKFECQTEEWLFSRRFTYLQDQGGFNCVERNRWQKLWYRLFASKPKPGQYILFLEVDDLGIYVHNQHQIFAPLYLKWDNVSRISLSYTIHPWDTSEVLIETQTNGHLARHETLKTVSYLEEMTRIYPHFNETFQKKYIDKFSLYLEHTVGYSQIQIPTSWFEGGVFRYLDKKIKEEKNLMIETNEDEMFWNNFREKYFDI